MRKARAHHAGLLLLDLGTQRARAAVACMHEGTLRIRGAAETPFGLLRDGIIVHLEGAGEQLSALLHDAARHADVAARRVVVAVGGTHVRSVRARGSLSLRMPVCLRDAHLERALDAAAAIGLPRDHEMLHLVPTGFRVDGARTVRPRGMRARRLVAEAAVLTVSRLALENLERALQDAGFELLEPVAEPLVAAHAAVTPEDRTRGAIVIDLGAERVSATAFRDGVLQGVTHLGAGAAHITRDLAFVLRIDAEQAERLKKTLGVARVTLARRDRQVPVSRDGTVLRLSQLEVARVIEPRIRELLTLTRDALRAARLLAAGDRIVLAGGGARLHGADEVAEQVFGVPARVYAPDAAYVPGLESASPGTLLGLLDYASRCGLHRSEGGTFLEGAVRRLRNVLGVGGSRPSASGHARPEIRVAGPQTGRSVHVSPTLGVDLEVGDVRVRA